jgi:hypothetical protein
VSTTSEIRLADGDVIEFGPEYQGVTLWLGDGLPVTISDDTADVDIADLIQSPGQRAVTIARLQRIVAALSS